MNTAIRVWFSQVSKRDARLLCEWWNAHSSSYFFMRRSDRVNRRAAYDVIKE